MEWARSISGRGGRAAKSTLFVRALDEFSSIDNNDHLVSKIRLPGNVGPAFQVAAHCCFDHSVHAWQVLEPPNSGAGSV